MNKGKKLQSGALKKKGVHPGVGADPGGGIPPQASGVDKPPEKVEKKKKDTKAFEQLSCMCCEKKLWVKSEAGPLIPGCSCALYLPGHTKCGKCSLHCVCEGRVHG